MIEVQLTELDLSLEVAEITDLAVVLDEHSSVGLQGPLVFGVDTQPIEYGYLDLDLIGFPYHGLSAYELAVKNGFVGSLTEWLASLKGEDGELGQAGQDAVARAEAAAASASGDALAAAGFRSDAYTYSGVAGVHAQSAAEMYTQAVAARDETGQIAQAMTYIRQESEAMIIGARELATATIQERVLAETARAAADLAAERSARSETNAESSSASASDSATMAVDARNQAGDAADAAIFAQSEASTYADNARIEADAARRSQLSATAARDEANITAAGVIIEVDKAKAYADDAEAYSNVSRDQRILAEAANTAAGQSAAASLSHSQTADAKATAAGASATAAEQERIKAETASGAAGIARDQSVTAKNDALGYRTGAKDYYDLTVIQRTEAGQSAAAAVTARNEAQLFADQSGQLYGGIAQRIDGVDLRVGNIEGSVNTLSQAVVAADGRIDTMYSLQLNSNGHIVGYVFQNNGSTGSMVITTNTFSLVDPNGGTPRTPFQMEGNVLTLTGEVRVNGSLILNGTVVGANAIQKDTVMPIVSNYVAGTLTIETTGYTTVAEIYVNTNGSQVQVEFNGLMFFTHEPSGSFDLEIQLRRSGGGYGDLQVVSETVFGAGNTADNVIGKWPIKVLDRPPAGTIRYYVNVRTSASNMTVRNVLNRFMSVMEYRTNT